MSTNLDLSLVSLTLWCPPNRVRITTTILCRVLHLICCGTIRGEVRVDDVIMALSPRSLWRLRYLLLKTILSCAVLAHRSLHA